VASHFTLRDRNANSLTGLPAFDKTQFETRRGASLHSPAQRFPLPGTETAVRSAVCDSRLRRGVTDRSLDEESRGRALGDVAGRGSA
jgi:hypothetical protein